jgi:bifunctional non-homologous end joining protein LigD
MAVILLAADNVSAAVSIPMMVSKRKLPFQSPPAWIRPQLAALVTEAPSDDGWVHELKYDGYRLHARLDGGTARLLTRSGLDWTHKYPPIAASLAGLKLGNAYLDGELCALRPDGTTSFSGLQAATDTPGAAELVYFAFDLLFIDGADIAARPLLERKARLERVLASAPAAIRYSDHHIGDGPRFRVAACQARAEGVVSKRADAPYKPDDRGLWRKSKCLNREEFVIVGFTDPEGSRPYLGALLLAYYTDDGRLIYAGRAGGGMSQAVLRRLHATLMPLAIPKMPLAAPPPRTNRCGSPLNLTRVHWVRPELVCEVTFLSWTDDGLLRQVTYQGLRGDKPAAEVRRPLASMPPP